jgi:hypothetical protein
MAAVTILQVMQGIETRLKTIDGLRVTYYIADQVNPPQAVVGCPPIDSYRATFRRGVFLLQPQVVVLTSAALDRVGQTALAEYANPIGAKSIPAAIEGDRTLGGVVEDCVVDSFQPLGMEEVGLIGYYGGVFDLRVVAPGS